MKRQETGCLSCAVASTPCGADLEFSGIRSLTVSFFVAVLTLTGGCAERGIGTPGIVSLAPSESSPAPHHEFVLRVATANLWGVSVLGFDWADEIDLRFAEFAERLGQNLHGLDVVLIQEAWKDAARQTLLSHDGVQRNFPYRVDVLEKPGGAGLVVLSRFPIEAAHFHRFAAQGQCLKFWEGDCLSGKGVLAVRIRIAEANFWVATTHLIACYADNQEDEVACDQRDPNGETRMQQILETREFMERLVGDAPAILGGDFNFTRSSRYYPTMTSQGVPVGSSKTPSTHTDRGWTEVGESAVVTNRIDFIWSRRGLDRHWRAKNGAELIFTEPVVTRDGGSIPISDHPILAVPFCLIGSDEASEVVACSTPRP